MKIKIKTTQLVTLALVIGAFGLSIIDVPFVKANSNDQIKKLKQEIDAVEKDNQHKEEETGLLGIEATSLNDAIYKLQLQIDGSQARIGQLSGDVTRLNTQITESEAELVRQKSVLGESIKAIYIEGDISTLEILATSKDLSEFFDKQQYRQSVNSKIKQTLEKVTKLKAELTVKKASVQASLNEQKALQNQLDQQRAEKDNVLALNQSQRSQLEGQIKANSGKLAELKKKQAEAEAALARALAARSYQQSPSGTVTSGLVVGAIGSTGLSSGPHLHLEVRNSAGAAINPAPYIKNQPVAQPPGFISQGYGVANPIYYSGYHRGIDYASSSGAPIYAIDNGTLYRGCSNEVLGTRNNEYGYVAIVEHPNGLRSVYAHMSGGPAACNYNTYY